MDKRNFFSKLRSYFEYHKDERIGIFSLILLILIVILLRYWLPVFFAPQKNDYSIYDEKIRKWEKELNRQKEKQTIPCENFYFDPNSIDSLGLRKLGLTERQTKTILNYRVKGGRFRSKKDFKKMYGIKDSTYQRLSSYIIISKEQKAKETPLEVETHPFFFNPNTISFDSMLLLGFSNKTAAQIVGYRNKGGKFYKKENLLKIYSIDSSVYRTFENYIQIPKQKPRYKSDTTYIKKRLLIEVNSADTLDLQQLYGIGPGLSRNIVKYRELLGGYLNKEQLKEVYGITEERYQAFESQIFVDTTLITKININRTSVKQLIKHPYIDFSIAKRILLLRKAKGGKIENIAELREIDMLFETLFNKLKPYLTVKE